MPVSRLPAASALRLGRDHEFHLRFEPEGETSGLAGTVHY